MYFKLFKLRDWRKRSGEGRRHNCAVLPKFFKPQDCGKKNRRRPQTIYSEIP